MEKACAVVHKEVVLRNTSWLVEWLRISLSYTQSTHYNMVLQSYAFLPDALGTGALLDDPLLISDL
jgi:hypothetical protein